MTHRELRNKLIDKRTKLGLQLIQLANMLGLKQSTYNHYECGKGMPKGERKKIIEDFLNS